MLSVKMNAFAACCRLLDVGDVGVMKELENSLLTKCFNNKIKAKIE